MLAKYAEVTLEIHLTLKRCQLSRFWALMCLSCTLAHTEEKIPNNKYCQPISVWESISVCSVSEKEESEKLSHGNIHSTVDM